MRPVGSRQNFIDVLGEASPGMSGVASSSPYCALHRADGLVEV